VKLVADLSNNNAHVSLWHLKAAGCAGVYHKATEGRGYVDRFFSSRRALAHKVSLPFGAYHFAHVDDDPVYQATLFCSVIGKLQPTDLRPALDVESEYIGGRQINDPRKAERFARAFNKAVHVHLGVIPLFYSNPGYITQMRIGAAPIGDGLWLASYGRNDGKPHVFFIPRPWRHVTMHQFTSVGVLNGVPMRVDLSRCDELPFAHNYTRRVLGR
jgi:lysozyme